MCHHVHLYVVQAIEPTALHMLGMLLADLHPSPRSSLGKTVSYSARCLRVLDCSALYDWAIQKTSPKAGRQVSRYNWEDWVKNASSPK